MSAYDRPFQSWDCQSILPAWTVGIHVRQLVLMRLLMFSLAQILTSGLAPLKLCIAFSGAAAVEAVATIQRLQLFAAVFQAPPTAASLLGSDYGLPCLAVMTAAAQLLDAIDCTAPVGLRLGLFCGTVMSDAVLKPCRACGILAFLCP